jgi:hypothetical protein
VHTVHTGPHTGPHPGPLCAQKHSG